MTPFITRHYERGGLCSQPLGHLNLLQPRIHSSGRNLTDVTLVNEDTNSIQTDNANRAIQGNVAMHVTLPGGQLWN